MHVLFPRYYEVLDEKGNLLIEGSALWALIDSSTRKLVFPEKAGVHIDGMEGDRQIPLPETLKRMETDRISSLDVPYSLCDLNGHLNNTRYFDLFEDTFYKDREAADYVFLKAEYLSEVRFGNRLDLSYLDKDDQALVYELMLDCVCTPSHAQSIRIRRLAEKEILCEDLVEEIMREEKSNQKEKIHIRYDQIRDYIPRNISFEETTEYIKAALKFYQKAHAKK